MFRGNAVANLWRHKFIWCFGLLIFVWKLLAPAPVFAAQLPDTYLMVMGNQIVDTAGNPVRLACVGYVPYQGADIAKDLAGMVGAGFNCLRYPWYDATLAANLQEADVIVADATAAGLKVILDHHGDEAPTAENGYLPYPCNGLPFDLGAGTDGTDDNTADINKLDPNQCATNLKEAEIGNVNEQDYVNDWAKVAAHYAGNPTVIGFDLCNEPHLHSPGIALTPGSMWGTGGPVDLRSIYEQAGSAIENADPGVLIIAEGIINWTPELLDNKGVNSIQGETDLSLAATEPVTLTVNGQVYLNHVVYSVHEYPQTISASPTNNEQKKIRSMNDAWGYLETGNIAPIWIGEMGASLDGQGKDSKPASNLTDEKKWAKMMVAYLNGQDGAIGGPSFDAPDQGVSTDWWYWGYEKGGRPDGTQNEHGTLNPAQQRVYDQLQ